MDDFCTPEQIANHFGISERRVRADARRTGFCRIVGNKMFLTQSDVDGLLEFWRPKPVEPRLPGRSGGISDYQRLVAFREEQALAHLGKAASKGRTTRKRS
jgi:hypothetical protein